MHKIRSFLYKIMPDLRNKTLKNLTKISRYYNPSSFFLFSLFPTTKMENIVKITFYWILPCLIENNITNINRDLMTHYHAFLFDISYLPNSLAQKLLFFSFSNSFSFCSNSAFSLPSSK